MFLDLTQRSCLCVHLTCGFFVVSRASGCVNGHPHSMWLYREILSGHSVKWAPCVLACVVKSVPLQPSISPSINVCPLPSSESHYYKPMLFHVKWLRMRSLPVDSCNMHCYGPMQGGEPPLYWKVHLQESSMQAVSWKSLSFWPQGIDLFVCIHCMSCKDSFALLCKRIPDRSPKRSAVV